MVTQFIQEFQQKGFSYEKLVLLVINEQLILEYVEIHACNYSPALCVWHLGCTILNCTTFPGTRATWLSLGLIVGQVEKSMQKIIIMNILYVWWPIKMASIKLLHDNKHPNGHFTILRQITNSLFFNLNFRYNTLKYSDEAPSPKHHYGLSQKNDLYLCLSTCILITRRG